MYDIQKVRLVCKWLIYNEYADNDGELAKLIGYTKSSFSQIMNGKVPLSSKFIDKLCELDQNINKVWILRNEGEMLNNKEEKNKILNNRIEALEKDNIMLHNIINDKNKIIEGLERENQLLREARENNQDKSKPSHIVENVTK